MSDDEDFCFRPAKRTPEQKMAADQKKAAECKKMDTKAELNVPSSWEDIVVIEEVCGDALSETLTSLSSLSLNTTHVGGRMGQFSVTSNANWGSDATAAVSINASLHAQKRMIQRIVPIRAVQEAKKRGQLVLQFGKQEEITKWAHKAATQGAPFTLNVDRQRDAEGLSGTRIDVPVLPETLSARAGVVWLEKRGFFASQEDQKVRYELTFDEDYHTEVLVVVEGTRAGDVRRSIITVYYREGVDENNEYHGGSGLWSGVVPLLDSFEQLSDYPYVLLDEQWLNALLVVSFRDLTNLKHFLEEQARTLLGKSCDFYFPCMCRE
jgi:hypothetical protein